MWALAALMDEIIDMSCDTVGAVTRSRTISGGNYRTLGLLE